MKKVSLFLVLLLVTGSTLFTSCSNEEDPQRTLEDQLMDDQQFTDAAIATFEFVYTAVSNDWLVNLARVQAIVDGRPFTELTDAERADIEDLLGMDIESYLSRVADMANSVSLVYDKYPALSALSQQEQNQLFARVLQGGHGVDEYLATLDEEARGPFDWIFCYLHDACVSNIDWLIPTIQGLLANACDLISGVDLPIPFLDAAENFVCTTLPGYVESFLPGICDWIPCEP